MLDIAVSYNKYKFLGYEFLTWLWYVIENDREWLNDQDPELVTLDIGNCIVLENREKGGVERISIKGDDAGLEEGVMALDKGAFVVETNLVYKTGDNEWRFTLKGESFNVSNLKPPEVSALETEDEFEGLVLEKMYLYEKVFLLIDKLYSAFIEIRLSEEWKSGVIVKMRKWIDHQTKSGN